ncbi:isopeptide-forming domain-containing fimbrial protein [Stieleria sp. TO1_6]|uniref:isopeptide-forming domain-containing fimbrial protein n=1 Tax=Stieleria tagensis TaxID=2956795 RepID=UPI00209A7560|nr:isopeptide-forming domain-containing fimbrial protein [Stieleria tagensis]MCO8124320.1 isopeptide-forming domain-containing fimbrial protein [Stieleria tagensis]
MSIGFPNPVSVRNSQSKRSKRRGVLLQQLERRVLLNAVPDVSIDVPDEAFVGESFDFEITFDMPPSTTETGYGPFIDIVIPRNGADGAAGTDVPDGIGIDSGDVTFDFFGSTLTPVYNEVVDATGTVEHPLLENPDGSPVIVTGLTPGDRFIVLQLPIGSYDEGSPELVVTGSMEISDLADVGVGLDVQVRGGFQYGCDPLDNPSVDDPNATVSGFTQDTVTPEIIRINKVVNAHEQETVSGANFPQTYTITVDIAEGQTVTDLTVSDLLPNTINYQGNVVIGGSAGATGTISDQPGIDALAENGTDELVVEFASVMGTAGDDDVTVTFSFYIPELDGDGNPIIDPTTGQSTMTLNPAEGEYTWDPIDPRDPIVTETVEDPADGADQKLTQKSLATQKSVDVVGGGPAQVGSVLEYRIEFQVSDYFDFDNIVIDDLLSDGQSFDSSFTPTLEIMGNNGNSLSTNTFEVTNYDDTVGGAPNYEVAVQFRVSDELGTELGSGQLTGNDGLSPGTTGVVVFRTTIDSLYRNPALGGQGVVEGDQVSNDIDISATVAGSNESVTDGSQTTTDLDSGTLIKEVYAVDGVPISGVPTLGPGDTITYRLTYDLPQTRFDDLTIGDVLPSPVFDASSLTQFNNTVLTTGTPAVGEISYGPQAQAFFDLYFTGGGMTPTLQAETGANAFSLDFGSFEALPSQATTIDLLYTVEFQDFPFADGLTLANIGVANETSTDGDSNTTTDIGTIVSQTPDLNLVKGVVSTDASAASFDPNPVGPVSFADPGNTGNAFSGSITSADLAANPIDSNLEGIDAGDFVKFAIVIENTGSDDGYDLVISDTLPSGFDIPTVGQGLNLQVTRGDGTVIDFNDTAGNPITAANAMEFFTNGIELVDPADVGGNPLDGVIDGQPDGAATGSNIIIVTFDLQANESAAAGSQQIDTGELVSFGAINNGVDWTDGVDGDFTDDAIVTITTPILGKQLTGTEIVDGTNAFDEAVIGELVTFDIIMTLPEGTLPEAVLTDYLGQLGDMAFVSYDGYSLSSPTALQTDLPGGFAAIAPVVTADGQLVSFDLGTIVNSDTDNDTAETITLSITAVVLNDVQNQSGSTEQNFATLEYLSNGQTEIETATSDPVTVIEPDIEVEKTATVNGVTAPPAGGDTGDVVVYTIVIRHSGNSETDAYEMELSDTLPTLVENYSITSVMDTETGADAIGIGDVFNNNGVLQFAIGGDTSQNQIDFAMGREITIQVSGELVLGIQPNDVVTNTAEVQWTSLDGDPGERSTFNNQSVERTGADGPGGALNDYADQDTVSFTADPGQLVKSIVSTSESHTGFVNGIEQVAIGEIVRYRLVTQVPESEYLNSFIEDLLPTGMTYLNDGTTTIALVGDQNGLFTSSTLDPSAFVMGDETTINSITPTFVLTDDLISTSTTDPNADDFQPGSNPFFNLGTVDNVEDDANQEFIVIEFNAIVNNLPDNIAGNILDNQYDARINFEPPSVPSDPVSVQIVEPDLTVDKVLVNSPADGRDLALFVLTVSNSTAAGVTTAFDINLTDQLDPNLDLISLQVFSPSYATATDNSDVGVGNNIDLVVDRLDPGGSFVVLASARVVDDVDVGLTIPNEVDVTYTSLPGDSGTGPNPTGSILPTDDSSPGDVNGERTGDRTGPNDYFTSDNVSFTLETPTVSKSVAPDQYTIGEIVSYDLLVELNEGTTLDLSVVDDLPDGLEYVGFTLVTDAASSGGLLTADYNGNLVIQSSNNPVGSGTDLTIDFGDTLTTADNNANNNSFLVRVDARVLNVIGNQDGVTLTNTANVEYTNPNNGTTDLATNSVDITLIEPNLIVEKSINSPTTAPDAGDVIQYQVEIRHDGSSSDAFEVMFEDLAPTNTLITNVVSVASPGLPVTLQAEILGGGTSIVLSDMTGSGEFDLPQGIVVTLIYEVTVQDTIGPGEMIMNQANIQWSSLDGDVNSGQPDGERDGSNAPTPGSLNDYFDSDKTTITTAVPTIEKTLIDTSQPSTSGNDLLIGEEATFRITITLPEATYPNDFVVSDLLPITPGVLELVSATYVAAESDSNVSFSNLVTDTSSGNPTFTFTDLVNGVGAISNENMMVFEVVAVLTDVPANQNGDTLINTATLTYPGFTDDATTTVDVVEPVVMIDKTSATTTASVGDTVTYTLTVDNLASNGSTADAFDLVISDDLLNSLLADDTLDLVVGSVVITSQPAGRTVDVTEGNDPGDDTVEVTVDQLAIDEVVTIEFQAVLNANVDPAGDTIINTSTVDYDNLPGPGGRTGTDNDDHTIDTGQESIGISKIVVDSSEAGTTSDQHDTNITDLAIGEMVTYQVSLDLSAGLYNDAVILSDQLPDFLALVDGVSDVRIISIGSDITLASTATPTVANNTPDAYDDAFTISFDVDQVALPGSAGADATIVIEVDALVLNVDGNQDTGTPLTNTAQVDYATFTDTATADVELVEPEVELTKTIVGGAPTAPDAGDTVQYEVVLENTGTSTAYNVNFADIAPGDTLIISVDSLVATGFPIAGAPTAAITGGGTGITIDGGDFDMPVGATITLTYTIELQDSVTRGEMLTNDATVDWSSLSGDQDPGAETGERDGSSRPDTGGLNNYFNDDTVTITVGEGLELDKTVVGPTVYSIGDTVTYQIEVSLFEGSTPDVIVLDDIPDVMTVDTSTVMVIAGSNFTFNPTAPVIDFSGGVLTVNVGDVVNTGDNDSTNDSFIIQYEALIVDDPGNVDGQTKTNTATVTSTNGLTDTDDAMITLVEPVLTIDKSSPTTTASVGDTVTYTLVVSNSAAGGSSTDAFDLVITDSLLNGMGDQDTLDLVVGSVTAVTSGGGTVTIATGNSAGDTALEVDVDVLELGETVTITFDAILNANVDPAGDTIINTSVVDYDSLPGTGGRTGTDNDDHTIDTGQESIGISKIVVDSSEAGTGSGQHDPAITDLAIGETVTYQISLDLSAGLYNDAVILSDQLPDFLAIVNDPNAVRFTTGSGITLNGSTITLQNNTADAYDDAFEINFDVDQVALPSGTAADSQIIIEVDALVLNVDGNQDTGTPLTNTAQVDYATFTDTATADVELVEPEVELTKTIVGGAPTAPDAGDTVQYEVVLENTGTSTAYNVNFADIAPGDTLIISVDSLVATGFPIAGAPTAAITGGGTGITIEGGDFDMPVGATITLTYTIELQDSVTRGEVLTNDATVDWSSLSGDQDPGAETGERDGSSRPDTGGLNNYFNDDTVTITVGEGLELDKTVVGPTEYAIGDVVTYQLEVTMFEGTTTAVVVTDNLPDRLIANPLSVSVNAGGNFSFSQAPVASFSNGQLTIDLGDVVNQGDNNTANDSFLITYNALVVNDSANNNNDVKTNDAQVTSTNGLTDNDTADITIIEPFLEIEKSISDDTPHLGDTVTYTFDIMHTGASTANAFDLLILDTLPPEMTLDVSTIMIVAPVGSTVVDSSSGNTIDISIDELLLGDTVTVSFDAEVTSDINSYGALVTNAVDLDWDNQPGFNPEQRPDNTDDSVDATIVGPDLTIDKSTVETELVAGQVFEYTFVVTNKAGPYADVATNVVVTDVLPDGISFAGSSDPYYVSNDPSTGTVIWEIPTMAIGETVDLQLTVRLSDPAPPTEFYINGVQVTHNDVDPTPIDNVDLVVTPDSRFNTPDLTVTKDDGITQAFLGDTLTYQIVVTNVGIEDATGVTVTDTFPDDVLNFVSASDGGVYDPTTGIVTWDVGFLAGEGGQIVLTLTGQVKNTGLDLNTKEFTNEVDVTYDPRLGPDPTPENNHDTDTDQLIVYSYDSFNTFLGEDRELPRLVTPELPVETIMSGTANPGTTLYLEIRDGSGDLIGWRTTVTDVGGNYVANFQGVAIDESDHSSRAHETFAGYNRNDNAGYNLRRYYEPVPRAATFFSVSRFNDDGFRGRSGQVLHSMQAADEQPLQLTDLGELSAYRSRVSSSLAGE